MIYVKLANIKMNVKMKQTKIEDSPIEFQVIYAHLYEMVANDKVLKNADNKNIGHALGLLSQKYNKIR